MALIMMSKSWVIDPVLQQVAIGLTSGYKTGRLACQTLILFRKAIDWRLSEHIIQFTCNRDPVRRQKNCRREY